MNVVPRPLPLLFLALMLLAQAASAAPALTAEQVEHWIRTEIEVVQLQRQMKAHPERYTNLIQTFYKRRDALLRRRGYQPAAFEALGRRIDHARQTLEDGGTLIDQQIREIREDDFFNEEQKREMIRSLEDMRAEAPKDTSRQDWPAVRAWRDELEALTHWAAGNTPSPPAMP